MKGASQLPQAVPSASVQSSGAGPGGGRSNEYFGPAGQATEEPPFQTDGLLCARRDSGGKRCFSDNCYQQSNIQTELITEISHEWNLKLTLKYFLPSGSDWDSVCGGNHVAATTEGEDGASSLSATSGSGQMGESLQRTGTRCYILCRWSCAGFVAWCFKQPVKKRNRTCFFLNKI